MLMRSSLPKICHQNLTKKEQKGNKKELIMTVETLIDRLKNLNQDAEVYIYTGDINLMVINEVEQEAPAMVVIS